MPTPPFVPRSDASSSPVWVVRLPADGLIVPSECACCGAIASRSVRELGPNSSAVVLVPYCTLCHAHASRAATARISVAVSSGLLGLTLAFGLPLIWQPPSPVLYAAVV